VRLGDKVAIYRTLIGNHIQSVEWYHFNDLDLPVTGFQLQGRDIFDIEYLRNDTR